ncbi:MAG TPA: FxsA family protein, partial [Solirubrobacteraceae bacterium]|nr:FxsA family protein [Solirubrobacteraceae bacterium]
PLLVVLFITVPILELFVIIQIGREIGAWWTIAILIADSVLGSLLMRSQGRAAWRRFNEALQAGRPPAREVLDGVLIIFGGALLLTPGFVTDVVGLTFLLPPTRAVLRRLLVRRFAGRMIAAAGGPRPRPGARSYDVEGHATEIDPRRLP